MPADRHLLVDAHNVIHAWPELREVLRASGPAAAQARLAERVRPIHDAEGWRVTLVCDGQGEELAIERPGREKTFSVAFSPRGLTADGVIQQLVANAALPPELDRRVPEAKAKSRAPARPPRAGKTFGHGARPQPRGEIVVATRDHLLGEAAAANGALVLSPDGLREWCAAAAARESGAVAAKLKSSEKDWRAGPSPWDGLGKIRMTKSE